jgi:hypothetical protein
MVWRGPANDHNCRVHHHSSVRDLFESSDVQEAGYGQADWQPEPTPFADALRMEICAGNDPRHLRAIARKLIEMAEGGDLHAIKEVGDRRDGKCTQVVERGDVPMEVLSDAELLAIIRGGSREPASK